MTRRRIVVPVTGFVVAAVLTVAGACNRKHDPGRFSPTDPAVAGALALSSAATSISADGSSTTVITAEVTPAASAGRRTVDFSTSTGSFVGAEDGTPRQISVEVVNTVTDGESRGLARTTLRASDRVETAIVDAEVKQDGAVLAAARTSVDFVAPAAGTLTLTASPASIPADGFSRSQLTASLDAATPSDRRKVRFTASVGTLVGGTGTPSVLTVDADQNLRARAELVSTRTIGTSVVEASLVDVPGSLARTEVRFEPVDPAAILRIGTSVPSSPADGATVVQVFADVAPELPADERTVTFRTTAGTFLHSENPLETTGTAGVSNRVTVLLQADLKVVTALLTASVPAASDQTSLPFTRVPPETIIVLPDSPTLKADAMTPVTVNVRLNRSVGAASDGTAVAYSAIDPDTGDVVELLFRNAAPSAGGMTTVLVLAPTDTPPGTVTLRARVGDVVGQENIEVVP